MKKLIKKIKSAVKKKKVVVAAVVEKVCPTCKGTGRDKPECTCSACNGTGK